MHDRLPAIPVCPARANTVNSTNAVSRHRMQTRALWAPSISARAAVLCCRHHAVIVVRILENLYPVRRSFPEFLSCRLLANVRSRHRPNLNPDDIASTHGAGMIAVGYEAKFRGPSGRVRFALVYRHSIANDRFSADSVRCADNSRRFVKAFKTSVSEPKPSFW